MKVKVLIVEDEAVLALAYKKGLEKRGFEVMGIFSSGEDAVEVLERVHPNVILMDIKLAGIMDGIEAAGVIKAKYGIQCLIITGNTDKVTKDRALLLVGPQKYLVKPVDSGSLDMAIKEAVG